MCEPLLQRGVLGIEGKEQIDASREVVSGGCLLGDDVEATDDLPRPAEVRSSIEIDPAQPGYKHTILRPQPGGNLTCAAARLETPYGELVSDWNLENGRFTWEIVVPPNTTATAILPSGATHELAAGRHLLE